MDLNEIGNRIKTARLKKRLSQMELAELCNISSVHLSHIETGKVTMSLDCMLRLCHALKTTPNYILLKEYDSTKNKHHLDEYFCGLTNDEISYLIENAKLLNEMKLNR